jgi:SAM-dependent methyltransferase
MSASDDYTGHWDEKFRSRAWGRYPPEDLVRFMGRTYRNARKSDVSVLEVGCGPGANLWFLHREGYAVSGIDVSPAAIEQARRRLREENAGLNPKEPDLRVGNFETLPWPDETFDVVVDIFALYANTISVMTKALDAIARVMKPGGVLYSKQWGTRTTGYGTGSPIEPGTFDAIPSGPCCGMGVSHFFERDGIMPVFARHFRPLAIDVVLRSDEAAGQTLEEFHCQFRKNG